MKNASNGFVCFKKNEASPAGVWCRIYFPFESSVSVKQNDVDYGAPKASCCGFFYSTVKGLSTESRVFLLPVR